MTKSPENHNKGIIRALNAVAWILGILGIIAMIVLLFRFGKGGLYTEAKLESPEVVTSLLAGFYHWLFAFLCYAIGQVLRSEKVVNLTRSIGLLRFFGWGAILIGIIGAVVIFPKTLGMGPRAWYRIPGAFAFVIYNMVFGIPCLGIAALLKMNNKRLSITDNKP
ncbi:hypothetical protein ACFL7M_11495 [Thermodesulfobacteriota bacterium]